MSVIFSDEELTQIEKLYGMEFVQTYEKIWNERIAVKRYFDTVNQNHKSTTGWTQRYWGYKNEECMGVLENQTGWLYMEVETMKGRISDDMYEKLQAYLNEHDPLKDYRGLTSKVNSE